MRMSADHTKSIHIVGDETSFMPGVAAALCLLACIPATAVGQGTGRGRQ